MSENKIKDVIIAIDGHSSCGKSTLARALADRLDYTYIDTGAMYRAVALDFLNEGINFSDLKAIASRLAKIDISFKALQGRRLIYLNNQNVEKEIRTMRVSNHVSEVSTIPIVRETVVALQQEMGKHKRVVMEGRDIGTVVFPNAELKIFLTAQLEVRVERRYKELLAKGENLTKEEVRENLIKRDHIDSTRAHSPLKKAEDAWVIDNSFLSIEEQLKKIERYIHQHFT